MPLFVARHSLVTAKYRLRKLFHYSMPRTAAARHYGNDEFESRILDLLVDPKREAMDVGANWGQYASLLAKLCTQLLVFEPIPRLAFVLKRTLPPNAIVENKAVSNSSRTVKLRIPYNEEGLSTIDEANPLSSYEEIWVRTVPLDDYADHNVGFVKIDVEGHELDVLSGAHQLIARHRPIFLIEAEERHRKGTTSELFSLFERRNYRGLFVYRDKLLPTSEFEVERFQHANVFKTSGRRPSAIPYVNNFIFLPEESVHQSTLEEIESRAAENCR